MTVAVGERSAASLGARALARMCDLMVLAVVLALVYVELVHPHAAGDANLLDAARGTGGWLRTTAVTLVVVLEVATVGWWGATAGKKAVGVRVVRAGTSEAPGLLRALARSVGVLVAVVVPIVGPILAAALWGLAALDPGRRGPLDRLAGTTVVDVAAMRAR